MPTSTWSTMRQDILRPMGLLTSTTTTAALSSGANTVVDTKLRDRFPVDDYFNNQWFVHITSGNDTGKIRRITNYIQSSGTLEFIGTAWAGGDSPSFELTPFDPTEVLNLYNEAREIIYPDISMVRDVETIVTGDRQHTYTLPSTIRRVDRVYIGNRRDANSGDNLLLNGDFEDWDADQLTPGSQNNWTLAGSGSTFNKEAQTNNPENYLVLHGDNSGRLAVAGTNTTLVQTFTPASSSYTTLPTEGQEVNLSAWVYCNTADRVKLYIETAVGSFHGGTGWELMKASATLAHNATTAVVGVHVTASSVAAYIDEIWMTIGQSEITDVPYSELRNWDHVPPVAGASNGGILYFQEMLPSKHRIRVVGRDMLSAVSAEDSTVEVDGDLAQALYDKVRQLVALRMASGNISPNSNWIEMARQYEESYVRAVEGNLVKVKAPPVAIPRMVF